MFQSFHRDTLQYLHDFGEFGAIAVIDSSEYNDDIKYIFEHKNKFYEASCNKKHGFEYHPINNLCPEVVAKQKTEYILKGEKDG